MSVESGIYSSNCTGAAIDPSVKSLPKSMHWACIRDKSDGKRATIAPTCLALSANTKLALQIEKLSFSPFNQIGSRSGALPTKRYHALQLYFRVPRTLNNATFCELQTPNVRCKHGTKHTNNTANVIEHGALACAARTPSSFQHMQNHRTYVSPASVDIVKSPLAVSRCPFDKPIANL